jgi:AcrR family transcriptional regulator
MRDDLFYSRIMPDPIEPPTAQPPGPVIGRRERKKSQTRQALQAAALDLFARNGFAHTTVQQIADAVDVSERTFFRYFEAKEDLLLPGLVDFFDAVAEALRDRPATESPLAAIHAATRDAARTVRHPGSFIPFVPAVQASAPGIDQRLVKALTAWEGRLADLLAERAQTAEPALDSSTVRLHADVTARVAISVLRASMITARTRLAAGGATRVDVPEILAQAFAVAEAGCPWPTAARRTGAARP